MKCIGIIGGVGSGKSLITNLLKKYYNAFIIDADKIGHSIIKKGAKSYNLIVEHFGKDILLNNGEINRKILGNIVFNNKKQLKKLNEFTHPYIYNHINEQIINLKLNQTEFIVIESALLIEIELYRLVNEIWYIYTNIEERKLRLKKTRNYSKEKIKNIIKSQPNDSLYRDYADYIIDNSYTIEYSLRQIQNILL